MISTCSPSRGESLALCIHPPQGVGVSLHHPLTLYEKVWLPVSQRKFTVSPGASVTLMPTASCAQHGILELPGGLLTSDCHDIHANSLIWASASPHTP